MIAALAWNLPTWLWNLLDHGDGAVMRFQRFRYLWIWQAGVGSDERPQYGRAEAAGAVNISSALVSLWPDWRLSSNDKDANCSTAGSAMS